MGRALPLNLAGRNLHDLVRAADSAKQLEQAQAIVADYVRQLRSKPSAPAKAKQAAICLAQVVKAVLQRIGPDAAERPALVLLTDSALDGLDTVRGMLPDTAQSLQAEVLRYGLMRRLVAARAWQEALTQGWALLRSLCRQLGGAKGEDDELPLPDCCGKSKDAAQLVVGVLLNLQLCTLEALAPAELLPALTRLLGPVQRLEPWLR